jgi:diguanylate cyclase (GGDEF)-like protein
MVLQLASALRLIAMPLAVLLFAALALAIGPSLPPSLAGLTELGPYAVLTLAAAVTLWFNRGRAFVAAVSLLAAYAGYRYALELGPMSFPARASYTALALLVPFNMFLALALPERGVVHHGSWRWLLLVAAEALLVAWVASAGRSEFSGTAWEAALAHWALKSPPVPFAARVMFAVAFAAAAWRAWPRHSPTDIAKAGVLVAFLIACWREGAEGVFGAFMSAAGAILLIAVLQESHRMAFRDELTGLPSRRALEERLRALGPEYAVAMVDVDHFKNFNDTYGHDVGDQVLRLVAARLAAVEGGGRAFRYGGEEFTVLFPEMAVQQALPHLEAVRGAIEHYRMALREEHRPKSDKKGSKRRGAKRADESVSVTVSIGVAGPGKRLATPSEVIKAADEAMYRAKRGGRNRVSR